MSDPKKASKYPLGIIGELKDWTFGPAKPEPDPPIFVIDSREHRRYMRGRETFEFEFKLRIPDVVIEPLRLEYAGFNGEKLSTELPTLPELDIAKLCDHTEEPDDKK